MGSGEAGRAQCLLVTAHAKHDWWYTSSGGGHMLSGEPTEMDRRTEKNLKQWHCSGLERDLCTCATDGSAGRCPHHTQEDFDAADRARTPDAAGIEAALAAGLAAHRQSFGSNDGDLWTFCTCDPNVVLLRSGRSDGDVPGMGDPFYIDGDAAFRAHVAAALLPVVTQAQAAALREAADRWTQGAWSDVMLPRPTPPAVPVIAYANRVGDWLRARADLSGAR